MNCSACRASVASYLDDGLRPHDAMLLAGHLAACASCSAYAQELRHVDALLAHIEQVEPAQHFTAELMSKIAVMPVPRRAPLRAWWIAAVMAGEWLILVLLNAMHVLSLPKIAASTGTFLAKAGKSIETFYDVSQHFHMTTYVAIGAGLETAAAIVLAVVLRTYFMRQRAPFSGAITS